MNKLINVWFHPFFLPLIWFLYIFTTVLGSVRYFYILQFGEAVGIYKILLFGVWHVSTIFMVIFLATLVFWVKRYFRKGLPIRNSRSLFVVGLVSLITLFASNELLKLEKINYSNYLYSNFGVTRIKIESVYNLSIFVILLIVGCTLYKHRHRKIDIFLDITNRHTAKNKIALFSLVILFLYALMPLFKWKNYFSYSNASYEMMFEDYQSIINLQHVPEKAKIILPVQSSKWPAISNPPIVRYFLYPRVLVSSLYITDQEKAKEIGEAYFIALKAEGGDKTWPVIIMEDEKIVFKEGTTLTYKEMVPFVTKGEQVVYYILF